ncbi:MAG: AI-2E family transporter [Hyphomicrobium sp.]
MSRTELEELMHVGWHAIFWLAAAIVVAVLLQVLAPVLLPFAIGLGLAYFFNPLVDGLSAMSVPRWLSAALILLLSIATVAAALIFLAPILAEQAASFMDALPGELARLKAVTEEAARAKFGDSYPEIQAAMSRAFAGLNDALPALAASLAQSIWDQGTAAFGFLSLMLVTPLVFFYALLDWPKLVANVDSWLPRESAPRIRLLAQEIDDRVSAFIRGQGTVCLVLAVYYAVTLSLIGLRYGLLVGIMTGLMSFIPFAGWALGLLTATALAIIQYWPDVTQVLIVPGVYLVGQALDAAVLAPKIVGSKIGLHPVWLIFALLTFSYLFGFLGLLVAVPVAAAIGVLVRAALQTYLRSSVYHGGGARH